MTGPGDPVAMGRRGTAGRTAGRRLVFLGAGDSQGVPRWFCGCPVCVEARTTGLNRRTRPAVLLEWGGRRVLIDAPPELRLQLVGRDVRTIDAVFLTHAHNDHVAGVVELYDYVRWTGAALPVWIPHGEHDALRGRYPWLAERVDLRRLTGPAEFGGATFAAFEVPHGANGTAHALRIAWPDRAVAYVPDSIDVPEGLQDSRLRDLDLLVLGTSFYREDAPHELRSVCDVVEALRLTSRVRPRRVVFTHLGHGIDRRQPLPAGHEFAADGMELEF